MGNVMPALPAELQPKGALGQIGSHISTKIITPFVVVMLVLAAGGSYVVLNLVTGSLADRFTSQLEDAGRGVNERIVAVEGSQLEVLRLMTNIEGVDAAIQQGDSSTLQRLLVPLQANSEFSYVDVLAANGNEILALRPNEPPFAGALDPAIAGWDVSRKSLAGESDGFGNKWSALIETSYGLMLYTAGPVLDDDNHVVGAVLIGIPLDELLQQITGAVVASATVYTRDGKVLVSTLPVQPGDGRMNLTGDVLGRIFASSPDMSRRGITVAGQDYMELLGGFVTRDSVSAGLGVALPMTAIDESGRASRTQLTIMFSLVTLAILIIGLLQARRISRPVNLLVDACRAVSSGVLNTSVPINTHDETGILAHSFNDMTAGLREREKIRDAFGRYMTKQVSDLILNGDVKLGGETREVTLLMSDIRSFTSLSETMNPEAVVAFLNRYFGGMVECVMKHEGVVDKFMGDAILVVFGAPVKSGSHAIGATLTALDMRARMETFNDELIAEGRPPIRIGIGINTGEAVTGNIGSDVRMEYTVIGDAVNATQRTEDLTKPYKTDILVSETTVSQLDGRFILGEPVRVTLRGRVGESRIYPLIGLRTAGQEIGLTPLVVEPGPAVESAPEPRVVAEVEGWEAPVEQPPGSALPA